MSQEAFSEDAFGPPGLWYYHGLYGYGGLPDFEFGDFEAAIEGHSGVLLSQVDQLSWDTLKFDIDRGYPIIATLNKALWNDTSEGYHFVLLIGYRTFMDEQRVYLSNPCRSETLCNDPQAAVMPMHLWDWVHLQELQDNLHAAWRVTVQLP